MTGTEQIPSIGRDLLVAVISALFASLIFNWQAKHWSRWMPSKFGDKEKIQLLKEYKNTNRIAKVFGLMGLSTMLLYYRNSHEMTGGDWRGIGIALALMSVLPVVFIVAANLKHGPEKVKEALVAFVIGQRTPPKVLFVFIAICSITGMICAISVMLQPP